MHDPSPSEDLRVSLHSRSPTMGVIVAACALAGVALAMATVCHAGTSHPAASGDTTLASDVYPLPMIAGRWKIASVPRRSLLSVDGRVTISASLLELPGIRGAEFHWYSPQNVFKRRDLDPTLTDAQGAQTIVPVLALSVPRRPQFSIPQDTLWAGITFPLDLAGLDLSGARELDVWINDWRSLDRIRTPVVLLHIDLGVVSEDQMRAPDLPPNHVLDSEDRDPRDGVLASDEDTGVDAVGDVNADALAVPLDLTTATLDDLAGDDYAGPSGPFLEIDPRRWRRTNGTEANRSVAPIPDTEDLNLNNNLDTFEDYYEYTVDLSDGDPPHLVTDVYAEFSGAPVPWPPGPGNGWRRYRIPIDAADRLQFGAPDLSLVRHVRLWVDHLFATDGPQAGVSAEVAPILVLGGLSIVGDFPWFVPETPPAGALRSWPNPAHGSVTIAFALPEAAGAEVTIFDLGGRRVRRLSEGLHGSGVRQFTWDGRDDDGARVPPGLYLVEARGAGLTATGRMVWVE